MNDIVKSFFLVKVLNDVQFQLEAGSVHALMGENGAGKSTLMKVLAGVHKADSGTVKIDGRAVEISSPTHAQHLGIAMIHQELSPIPDMTVAENIFLSREPGGAGMLDYKRMYRDTEELLGRLHIDINPRAKMRTLKVADQQLVEIAKAISYDAQIIIMDEPTSAITDREVENLFGIIRSLKESGKGIIYISHKMDEIFQICDTITVLRDGNYIGTWAAAELDNDSLIKNMVGRDLSEIFPKVTVPIGDPMLEVKNLTSRDRFHDISFTVRRGEILGVAGLVGAGRTELMHTIFGLHPPDSGEVLFNGKPLRMRTPDDAMNAGIAYVSEDRKREGLVLQMSVGHNMTLASIKKFCKAAMIGTRQEQKTIDEQFGALNIKARSPAQLVASLSGGNQQKVVLAKWMINGPLLLILDEPTRGIDVGAKSEIYKIMCNFVAQGNAIIMVSSEMPEVMGMSDRVVVLSNRQFGGELPREKFTQENIMQLAVSKM